MPKYGPARPKSPPHGKEGRNEGRGGIVDGGQGGREGLEGEGERGREAIID